MQNPEVSEKNVQWFDSMVHGMLKAAHAYLPKRLAKWVAMYYSDAEIRKLYAAYIGVEMGEGTYANLGMKVVPNDNRLCVHLGNRVSVAPNVVFVCNSAANNGIEINEIDYVKNVLTNSGDIHVADEVWIGANVTILPNVTIGRCSVIGAGSVVTSDVEEYSIYAGTPARKIRDLRTGKRADGKQ